jgi:hypothetical protein
MKKRILITMLLVASSMFAADSYKPKNGFVPDQQTAIRIAEAVWLPIYGSEIIEGEKPFRATLSKGIWKVRGTLKQDFSSGTRTSGGVAIAEISKKDGRILRVDHER